MEDIIVITNKEYNDLHKRYDIIASHGVNSLTLEMIPLPNIPVQELGAVFDEELGEYVI